MTGSTKQYSIWAASMVTSLAAAFAAVGATQAGSEKMHCEIAASSANGIVTLEGRAGGPQALSGSWRFEVSGPGAQVRQGGAFGAAAGQTATLGSVRLGGSGPYEAKLEVSAGGDTVRCMEATRRSL